MESEATPRHPSGYQPLGPWRLLKSVFPFPHLAFGSLLRFQTLNTSFLLPLSLYQPTS